MRKGRGTRDEVGNKQKRLVAGDERRPPGSSLVPRPSSQSPFFYVTSSPKSNASRAMYRDRRMAMLTSRPIMSQAEMTLDPP